MMWMMHGDCDHCLMHGLNLFSFEVTLYPHPTAAACINCHGTYIQLAT